MNTKFLLLNKKDELQKYQKQITDLFEICFRNKINEEFWKWAYLDNPAGDAIVSLGFNEKEELVGHYAIIPYYLRFENKRIIAGLSMTTMVDAKYRKYGLFIQQASDVYKKAEEVGIEIIIGFPNKNSAPGFKKRLNWEIGETDYVAQITKDKLIKSKKFNIYLQKESIQIDYCTKNFWKWRLANPIQNYIVKDSVITKKYGDAEDILFIKDGYQQGIEDGVRYNILFDANINDFISDKLFDYQFGYWCANAKYKDSRFVKNLILSDIF